MPTPTIPDGELFFNATTYTGNGGTQTIVNGVAGQSFAPDFVWIKDRTNANNHILSNSVTDPSGWRLLQSNNANAEIYSNLYITSLNSNGFSLALTGDVNANGVSYVGWQWKAGGAAVTNTAGSISSQVSANTTSGFSVVSYTLNNSTFTVGHGLGVAPRMMLVKNRDTANNWDVYHASLGAGFRLQLNSSAGPTSTTQVWNNTAPTSTVFSGNSAWWSNPGTSKMIAYCFAPVEGYSAFSSYTGNGSADGPFVYLGFRPAFILVKRTDTTGNWCLFDNKRLGYNGASASKELYPNLSLAEGTSNGPDQLSNGFKFRDTYSDVNASGGTYIYMAFAESPFKYANAR